MTIAVKNALSKIV